MYRQKLTSFVFVSLFLLTIPALSRAQAPNTLAQDQRFGVKLQLVLASDSRSEADSLPRELAQISAELKRNFAFRSARLLDVEVGRLSTHGELEAKGAIDVPEANKTPGAPAYLEWRITDLRADVTPGRSPIAIGFFRYEMRYPGRVVTEASEIQRQPVIVNYTPFAYSLKRFSVDESVPTVIGSISLPHGVGTLFLVLTISKTDI